jgi:ribosomal protein S25
LVVTNPDEVDRLESIAIAKIRGKGPPKKKREKNSKDRLRIGEIVMLMCPRAISDEAKEKEIVTRSAFARFSGVSIGQATCIVGVIDRRCTEWHYLPVSRDFSFSF